MSTSTNNTTPTEWPGIRLLPSGQYEARIWWHAAYHRCGAHATIEDAKRSQIDTRATLNVDNPRITNLPGQPVEPCRVCGTLGGYIKAGQKRPGRTHGMCLPCYRDSLRPPGKPKTEAHVGDWKLAESEIGRRSTAEWAKALEKKVEPIPALASIEAPEVKIPKHYRIRNSTGLRGVYVTKEGHYKAQTCWGGKTHCAGTYASPELASVAVEAEYVRLKAEPPPPTMRPRDHRVKEYSTRLRAEPVITIETSIDLYRRAWRRIQKIKPIPPVVVESWEELVREEVA